MPFNAPMPVTCQANTKDWTFGRQAMMLSREVLLNNILLNFSTGCSNKVLVKIMLNGEVIAPNFSTICQMYPADPRGAGAAYFGDDVTYDINIKRILKENDKLEVWYINDDPSNDRLVVADCKFEIESATLNATSI